MAYNEKDDVVLKEIEVAVKEEAGNILTGKIMQYNKGQKKLQLGRKVAGRNGWQFAKLGRLTKEELPIVIELIEKLRGELE